MLNFRSLIHIWFIEYYLFKNDKYLKINGQIIQVYSLVTWCINNFKDSVSFKSEYGISLKKCVCFEGVCTGYNSDFLFDINCQNVCILNHIFCLMHISCKLKLVSKSIWYLGRNMILRRCEVFENDQAMFLICDLCNRHIQKRYCSLNASEMKL